MLPATVRRFPRRVDGARLLVPQLGWNRVDPEAGCSLIEPGYAYYANCYRLDAVPAGFRGARSDHGGFFVAAVERGAQLLCQFHPELSGAWGLQLLQRWLAASERRLDVAIERGLAC